MTQPLILSINLDHRVVEQLKSKDYNIYEGTVGNPIRLNIIYDYVTCLPQHKLPTNFHEFDIVLIDLTNEEIGEYNATDHTRTYNKTSQNYMIKCHAPQTIFDPRAYSLSLIHNKILELLKRPFMLIVFCDSKEDVSYNFVDSSSHDNHIVSKSNYSFSPFIPEHYNKHGLKTLVPNGDDELYSFLRRYNDGFSYNIAFYHSQIYKGSKNVDDPNFHPLIYNNQNEIVSFFRTFVSGSCIFFFPQVKEKQQFLEDFFQEIAPSYVPAIFPNTIKNSWTKDPKYYLPNHALLVSKKELLKINYQESLIKIETEIDQNAEKSGWLHDMLTATDTELVLAIIKFLTWLGFTKVKDGDTINQGPVKEEDIQIEIDKGLIILEVKGIGGTSKDSDCSQIGKIKARRTKQREKFDVFGSYIVNHQRHIPPHERKNPPFTEHQISDAIYDERGLITTWQLFNVYFLIEKGILSKHQVIEGFYNYGLIDFIPKTFIPLGSPKEFFKNNTIAIIKLPEGISLADNEEIFVVADIVYQKVAIKSLQVEEKNISSAKGVEVGVQLAHSILKNSIIYKII